MLDVYLSRHGQTHWNVEGRMQGRLNSPLTEQGIGGARALADKIREIPFSRCYSSPMPRALHTSHLLVGDRPVPLVIEQTLAEMDLGAWEGMSAITVKNIYPDVYYQFHQRPDLFTPVSGGETFADVVIRAQDLLTRFETLPAGTGPLLCVTHCILLQAIVMLCDAREMSTLRTSQAVDQTSLFHLQWDHKKWTVLSRNEPAY